MPGEAPRVKGYTRQVKRPDWPILHPGYISWAQFRRNQKQLDDNRTVDPDQRRGAVREGGPCYKASLAVACVAVA